MKEISVSNAEFVRQSARVANAKGRVSPIEAVEDTMSRAGPNCVMTCEEQLRVGAEEQFDDDTRVSDRRKDANQTAQELLALRFELARQNEALWQTQIALAESQDRYIDLYDLSPIGYVSISRDGRITKANRTSGDILCFERDRLPEKTFSFFVAPEHQARWHVFLESVQQKGLLRLSEIALVRGDGEVFFAHVDGLLLGHGRVASTIRLSIVDLGKASRADQILLANESRFRALYASTMAAYVLVDMSGRILLANDPYRSMLGYSEEELKGMAYVDLTPEKWHAKETRIIDAQVLTLGESEIYEKEFVHKDGTIVPVELKTILIRDAQSNPEGMLAVVCDVSERSRAEAALIESESRFQLAMKSVIGVVYDWNLQTDEIFFSEGLPDLIGACFDRRIPVRKWWTTRVHSDDVRRVRAEILVALKENKGKYQTEYRMQHEDGRWITVSNRAVIVRSNDGRATRLVGSVYDISLQVSAQQALRKLNDGLELQVQERSAQLEKRVQELHESERFVRATLDSISAAVCVIGENGRILFKNKVWAEFNKMATRQEEHSHCKYSPICCCQAHHTSCGAEAKIESAVIKALAGKRISFALEYEVGQAQESRWYLARISPFKGEGPIRLILSHEDITQRKLAAKEISLAAENFKTMLRIKEEEYTEHSKSIAREVHDQLGATLTMLKLGASTIAEHHALADPIQMKLKGIIELTDMALKSVKRITASLRPSMLDTLGLLAALKWHADEFSRMTGIQADIRLPERVELSVERCESVFCIVQEALTNVAKHSNANRVTIVISKRARRLIVTIADNGVGLKAGAMSQNNSFGFIGMTERAQHLNGSLSIKRSSEGGVLIALNIPLAD